MGHLKFMQLLLDQIFQKVKTVPSGKLQDGLTYDKSCENLDGERLWNPNEIKSNKNDDPPSDAENSDNGRDDPTSDAESIDNVGEQVEKGRF